MYVCAANLVTDIHVRSLGLSFFTVTITILDIIQLPVFYLKHDVSETGFCLRLQVEHLSGDRLAPLIGPK
jgi:hypothetical protein